MKKKYLFILFTAIASLLASLLLLLGIFFFPNPHRAAQLDKVFVLVVWSKITNFDNKSDVDGWTPLHVAAKFNSLNAIKALAANGANINARDILLNTPLHRAVLSEKEDAFFLLLDLGANRNIKNSSGLSAVELIQTKGLKWKI